MKNELSAKGKDHEPQKAKKGGDKKQSRERSSSRLADSRSSPKSAKSRKRQDSKIKDKRVSDSAVSSPSPLGFSVYPEPEQNAKETIVDLERVEDSNICLSAGPDANAADKRPRSEQGYS